MARFRLRFRVASCPVLESARPKVQNSSFMTPCYVQKTKQDMLYNIIPGPSIIFSSQDPDLHNYYYVNHPPHSRRGARGPAIHMAACASHHPWMARCSSPSSSPSGWPSGMTGELVRYWFAIGMASGGPPGHPESDGHPRVKRRRVPLALPHRIESNGATADHGRPIYPGQSLMGN